LDVGGLAIAGSKNSRGYDHGFLFQPADRQRFPPQQIDADELEDDDPRPAEAEQGFVRTLGSALPRLELLGHTLKSARAEYEKAAAISIEERRAFQEDDDEVTLDVMSFAEFQRFISPIAIADLDDTSDSGGGDDDELVLGRFKDEALKARLPFYPDHDALTWSERSYFGTLVSFLHPYTLLRLLADNEKNLTARLEWQYGPLVSNGWAQESEFVPGARRRQTYLIATEGSSDTHILKRAFELLRPEIADFFRFIDVSERHPFSGTGSLVKFAEGLAKIDVQNRTVFLLDNDAEGQSASQKIRSLALPANMRTMVLPHLKEFEAFPTIGPSGHTQADINGRAASIECYLDLYAAGLPSPVVRWANYKEDVQAYQGSLENKDRYSKAFFEKAKRQRKYDTSKLSHVLDAIFSVCTAMAEDMREDAAEQ